MSKRVRKLLSTACMAVILANGPAAAFAQEKTRQPVQIERKTVTIQGDGRVVTFNGGEGPDGIFDILVPAPGAAGQQSGDFTFQFFSQEMAFDNRLVKGAPFSASTVSETIQTLADGNRIVQRSEGRVYRDGQGRTRNERTYRQGGSSQERQTVTIYDPNSGEQFILDPEKREARKLNIQIRTGRLVEVTTPSVQPPGSPGVSSTDEPRKISVSGGVLQGSALRRVQPVYPPVAKAAQAQGVVQVQITVSENGQVADATAVSGHPLLREAAVEAARQWEFKPTELSGKFIKVQGVLTFNFTLANKPGEQGPELQADPQHQIVTRQISGQNLMLKVASNTEQLGKQTIEGVECEGTRITTTLPAGAIGNENPIVTVQENWYSPELKMTIMTRRTDPRFGESTYRVTGILRAEPDPGLFSVPSDYTIKEGPAGPANFRFENRSPGGGDSVYFFRREVKN